MVEIKHPLIFSRSTSLHRTKTPDYQTKIRVESSSHGMSWLAHANQINFKEFRAVWRLASRRGLQDHAFNPNLQKLYKKKSDLCKHSTLIFGIPSFQLGMEFIITTGYAQLPKVMYPFIPLCQSRFFLCKLLGKAQMRVLNSAALWNGWLWETTISSSSFLILIFIGPESDHWQPLSMTHSLTHSLLFSRLDWCDLACENLLIFLLSLVLMMDRVGNSLLKIWELRFGQYFTADIWLRFRSWILVKILKLGLVKISSLSLAEILMFGWDFEVNA